METSIALRPASARGRRMRGVLAAWSGRTRSREFRAAVGKRMLLGFLIVVVAILTGWVLVPPEAGTDQATVDWYSQ
jgi:hypothetical protein